MTTLVIGYGGFGCNVVKQYSLSNDVPCLLLDFNLNMDLEESPFIFKLHIGEDISIDKARLKELFGDYRNILLISSLGGESFDQAYHLISECASILNLPIVTLCTVPYVFESERRKRAFENLAGLRESVRNMFLIDSQKLIQTNQSMQDFMVGMSTFVQGCIDVLLYLTENTPFYSYCTGSSYTFALSECESFLESVKTALEHPLFDDISINGKILVCFDRKVEVYESDVSKEMLMSCSGNLPELVQTPGIEEGCTLLLIPISFRRHE